MTRRARLELHFLAGRAHIASLATPSVRRQLERAVVLIAEERPRLVAPAAADDVRVPVFGVGLEDRGGRLLLVADQVLTAIEFPCCGSNGLSHEVSSARRGFPERRSGSVTMNVEPRPSPGLSTRVVPPWSFTTWATMASPIPSPGMCLPALSD